MIILASLRDNGGNDKFDSVLASMTCNCTLRQRVALDVDAVGTVRFTHIITITMSTRGIEPQDVGFDFSNFARNAHLGRQLGGLPKGELVSFNPIKVLKGMSLIIATSTGTTIVGLKFGGGDTGEEEGVCLGADTRATGGPIVADKNCEKVNCFIDVAYRAHFRYTTSHQI